MTRVMWYQELSLREALGAPRAKMLDESSWVRDDDTEDQRFTYAEGDLSVERADARADTALRLPAEDQWEPVPTSEVLPWLLAGAGVGLLGMAALSWLAGLWG